jgi:hypothetical protein
MPVIKPFIWAALLAVAGAVVGVAFAGFFL